jgi:hypothetical protein
MKDDYLWDKKGSDAEVEGLEDLLASFRYESVAPPRLPVESITSQPQNAVWWKFSLTFAVPACLLIVIGIGFLLTRTGNDQQAVTLPNETALPLSRLERSPTSEAPKLSSEDPEVNPPAEIKTVKTIYTQPVKAQKPIRTKYRAAKARQFETLTSEERFAYDQLRLALSITGEKLKVVTDTVNRAED